MQNAIFKKIHFTFQTVHNCSNAIKRFDLLLDKNKTSKIWK